MDHLLSSSNGKGGGVEGCKKVSAELRQTLENDYEKIKRTKEMNENKKRRIQSEIEMSYNPISSLTPSRDATASSSQVQHTRSSGTTTLNSFWKPV